ncbi:MAG: hypothetical protein PF482_03370 [Desulfobacteraceae bacterium]|jgi:hypothetical protein|nr:hypothetical protein [Desulfobacteraceae bacterium]
MITFDGPEEKNQLPELLEGYLYGLGEVCHTLFGKKGEVAMYSAIGSYFLKFLKQKLGIAFIEENPWQRYCSIIKVFTSYGFYSHVELNEVGPNKYWMLETNQYAGGVWEEQGAWERGTPPCPLWSIILHSLSEINQTIILDNVSYNKECNGYESTFHFEKILKVNKDVIEFARNTLREVLIPICSNCKKIRDANGDWIQIEEYIAAHTKAQFSHGICKECAVKLYPDMDLYAD